MRRLLIALSLAGLAALTFVGGARSAAGLMRPAVVAAVSGRMKDRIELDSLAADLIDVVIQTMQPAHASLVAQVSEERG